MSQEPLLLYNLIFHLVVALIGCVFAVLGYCLYSAGIKPKRQKGERQIQEQPITAEAKGPLIRFALSGTGPGLFFMFFGAVVLCFQIMRHGAGMVIEAPLPSASNPNGFPNPSDKHLGYGTEDDLSRVELGIERQLQDVRARLDETGPNIRRLIWAQSGPKGEADNIDLNTPLMKDKVKELLRKNEEQLLAQVTYLEKRRDAMLDKLYPDRGKKKEPAVKPK